MKNPGKQEIKSGGKAYNKLVRDRIPDIIKRNGQKPVTRIASGDEFISALKEKIFEEADELKRAGNESTELEEIIDILEAVNAYMKHRKVSVKDAERMRKIKLKKRGGFDKKIILERVE